MSSKGNFKYKIMVITDGLLCGTGFSEEAKNIFYRLVQTGEFEVIWFNINSLSSPVDLPDTLFSDLPHKGATIKVVGNRGDPRNFGAPLFQKHYLKYHPEIVFFMGDPKIIEPYVDERLPISLKDKFHFPLFFYCTLDGLPVHPKNKFLTKANVLIAMTAWAQMEFAKLGLQSASIHHGINWNWWSNNPKTKAMIRRKYRRVFPEDCTLFITWEVPQHRKRIDALLRAWKAFKPETKNTKLLIYGDWNMDEGLGWNIEDLIEQYDVPRDTIISPIELTGTPKLWGVAEPIEEVRDIARMGDIYVSTTCFPEGTVIKKNFGVTNIEKVRIEDKIFSDGKFGCVYNHFVYDYDGEIIKIKISGRLPTAATPNHRIFVIKFPANQKSSSYWKNEMREGRLGINEWKMGELERGDYLCVPRFKGEKMLGYTNEEIEFYGYYLAEGCISRRKGKRKDDGIIFSISSNEKKFTKRILDLGEKIYGWKGKIYNSSRHRRTIRFWTVNIPEIFYRMGYKAGNKKMIDDFIYLNKKQIKILINALWRGDGCKYLNRSKGKIVFDYQTVSTQLAYQIQMLLDKYGVISSMSFNPNRHSYKITLEGKNREIFGLNEGYQKGLVTPSYILLPITKIFREKYKGKIHDLEMMDSSYYTTEFLVHNSGEGFGKCPLEALSLGIPVIITDYSACSEVCAKGSILVPCYEGRAGRFRWHDKVRGVEGGIVNEEKFTEAMLYLYNHPEERAKLGKQARLWAREFDYDTKIIPLWINLFKQVSPERVMMKELLQL